SSTDGQAVLPTDYTFAAGDAGHHTFSGVVLYTAGSQSVTAQDTGNAGLTVTGSTTVSPGLAASFSLAGLPAAVASGEAHAVTLTVRDSFGNLATGYTGTVHFSSTDPQAGLPADYTFTAGDAGTHTF